MSTFTIILLIIILVLISSDVFFLWKIFKDIGKRKKSLPDERYFELKYNINLLKAVSAILIFLLGFLGFTTYRDITSIIESDFEERFNQQQERINELDSIVSGYEEFVETLKSTEGQSIENLNDIKREFGLINNKVARAQQALRYSSRIYVVKNLEFRRDKDGGMLEKKTRIYFKNLRTSKNEELPVFEQRPIISIQTISNGSTLAITEVTKDYVEIVLNYELASRNGGDPTTYKFDIWIAEPN